MNNKRNTRPVAGTTKRAGAETAHDQAAISCNYSTTAGHTIASLLRHGSARRVLRGVAGQLTLEV